MRWIPKVILMILFAAAAVIWEPDVIDDSRHFTKRASVARALTEETVSLLFVGDLMLGRSVESLMLENGVEYPFEKMLQLLRAPDLTIGNFEGVVKPEHIQAAPMTFQFSIREEYLSQLFTVGFDVLSLANNHSFDYGQTALDHTRERCRSIGISCLGGPLGITDMSYEVQSIGSRKVGFLFLSTVLAGLDDEALLRAAAFLAENSEYQVAYVHWGDEYELIHNSFQEELARRLIDMGIDAVIGHHPHVVQDVEIYRNRPIFYSLGNFVFDQYFSSDVQEGLGVSVILGSSKVRYKLIPVESTVKRSQPQTVARSGSERLFERVLMGVASDRRVDVKRGILSLNLE